tara:strand:+ start:61 stop:1257 length:1197 start_codon:yes stop_codon:yes gene_type:complete
VNISNLKSRFPVFKKNPNLVFFDTAASALKVDEMIEATNNCYTNEYANIHRGNYELSAKLTNKYEDARKKVAYYLNVSDKNIIFVKSATEGINLVSSCMSKEYLKDEDEIILSYLEHHANLIPWHITGKKIKISPLGLNQNLEIKYDELKNRISTKTKLITLTHMSNVTGSITNFDEIKEIAKKNKIPLLLDGCQFAPHKKVDLKELDPDFYVFSAHKMYGPSGLGVLYMQDKWIDRFHPYQGGGQMINDVDIDKSTYATGYEKFEAGTPPIAPVIGFSSSLDFMKEIDPNNMFNHEMRLHDYAYEKLSNINGLKIYGPSNNKGAIISFNIEGIHNSDLGALLDKKNVAIRTGHHCCQPFMKLLNVRGTSRISFGVYNTIEDIDYLVQNIKEILKILT